jgi:hypothetical protein
MSSITEDIENSQDDILALQTNYTKLKTDVDLLRTQFDDLTGKLKYPGTKFLVDLEYRLVFDDTIIVNHDSAITSAPIEVLPGLLHAVYAISAYAPTSDIPIIVMDGAYVKVTTATSQNIVTVALQRQRSTNPDAITVSLRVSNKLDPDLDNVNVAIRVWRRLGMGS